MGSIFHLALLDAMEGKMKKRLSVLITEDLFEDFRTTIDWGLRQYLFAAILRLIIDAVKQDGMMVVGAILSGEYKLVRVEKDGDK